MIPKVIHYIHFGGLETLNTFREKVCKPSIEKFCEGYEIKYYDEQNLNLDEYSWLRDAYNKRKYNFLADYFRLKILYENGGIYFDTDVELVKSLDDIVNKNNNFVGLEKLFGMKCEFISKKLLKYTPTCFYNVAFGLVIGVEKNNKVIKEILDKFISDSNKFNCISPNLMKYTKDYFDNKNKNEFINIKGFDIYPSEYFCPIPYNFKNKNEITITNNTYSIHHYDTNVYKYDKLNDAEC